MVGTGREHFQLSEWIDKRSIPRRQFMLRSGVVFATPVVIMCISLPLQNFAAVSMWNTPLLLSFGVQWQKGSAGRIKHFSRLDLHWSCVQVSSQYVASLFGNGVFIPFSKCLNDPYFVFSNYSHSSRLLAADAVGDVFLSVFPCLSFPTPHLTWVNPIRHMLQPRFHCLLPIIGHGLSCRMAGQALERLSQTMFCGCIL